MKNNVTFTLSSDNSKIYWKESSETGILVWEVVKEIVWLTLENSDDFCVWELDLVGWRYACFTIMNTNK